MSAELESIPIEPRMHDPAGRSILLVAADHACAAAIARAFVGQGQCQLVVTGNLDEARRLIEMSGPDLVIAEARVADGRAVELKDVAARCAIILIHDADDARAAEDARLLGAIEALAKNEENIGALPLIALRAMDVWEIELRRRLESDHQRRLIGILDATPDMICMFDPDGFLTYINPAGRRMLGISRSERIKRVRINDFHTPDDGMRLMREALPHAARHHTWTGEIVFIAVDGSEVLTSMVLICHHDAARDVDYYSMIAHDIRNLRAVEERVEFFNYYDPLTGLPNRKELVRQLDVEVVRNRRSGRHSALLMINVDSFRYLNDTLGHEIGDRVLCEIGKRIKSRVRAQDIVAHLNADEFAVVLSSLSRQDMTAIAQVRAIADKIRDAVNQDIELNGDSVPITACSGVYMVTGAEHGGENFLRFASTAMRAAKREGRDRLEFFRESMSTLVARKLDLEIQLHQALKQDQFRMFYQPVVDCAQRVVGAEALIRWQHPERGLIAPDAFLDVLESSGQVVDVGKRVFIDVLAQTERWLDEGLVDSEFRIAINVSPRQFSDQHFIDDFCRILECSRVPRDNIVLEITEQNVISDLNSAIERMQTLIDGGVGFALDDFGTGYSSLSHLKHLPVTRIKIDRSFVRDICRVPRDRAMLMSILAMCQHLDLKVVAEGVEERPQFELMNELGCRYYQGFYFGRPMAGDEMTEFLRARRARATIVG